MSRSVFAQTHTVDALPLVIGAGSNLGLPLTHPLSRPAGSVAEFRIEGGVAQAPLLLVADYGLPPPLYPWPDPTAALVLGVGPFTGSPGPLVPILDGLGWFGPAQPITFDAQGTLSIPGVQIPAPPLGVTLVLQALYPDATAPLGIRLTWALTVTL